jgi:hypothetical protein
MIACLTISKMIPGLYGVRVDDADTGAAYESIEEVRFDDLNSAQ